MDESKEWIFTFSCASNLHNNFVRISGTMREARDKMFEVYASDWAFCYPSEEKAGVEQFGLTEVPLGTPNERL